MVAPVESATMVVFVGPVRMVDLVGPVRMVDLVESGTDGR